MSKEILHFHPLHLLSASNNLLSILPSRLFFFNPFFQILIFILLIFPQPPFSPPPRPISFSDLSDLSDLSSLSAPSIARGCFFNPWLNLCNLRNRWFFIRVHPWFQSVVSCRLYSCFLIHDS